MGLSFHVLFLFRRWGGCRSCLDVEAAAPFILLVLFRLSVPMIPAGSMLPVILRMIQYEYLIPFPSRSNLRRNGRVVIEE